MSRKIHTVYPGMKFMILLWTYGHRKLIHLDGSLLDRIMFLLMLLLLTLAVTRAIMVW